MSQISLAADRKPIRIPLLRTLLKESKLQRTRMGDRSLRHGQAYHAPNNPANLVVDLLLQGEVALRLATLLAVMHERICIVLEDEEVVCAREREHFAPPCLRRSHAGWVSTVLCKRYGIRERWRQGAKDRDVWTYGYGVEDLGLGLVRGPVLELGAEGISIDALGVRRYGYRKDRFPISTSQAASVHTYKLAMQ